MSWQVFGFTDDPLKTSPITKATLSLFTGHAEASKVCMNVLSGGNARIVIEGARGVGTTSFGNYLRFNSERSKQYFTPRTEIKVEKGWRLETLLATIVSNTVREIELRSEFDAIVHDKRFQAAKSLSSLIAETYRSFGIDAFGFGANYQKQPGLTTQPLIVPSPVLGHHIEDLIALIKEVGYKKGLLLQLNNLDIGEIHSAEEMKYLLNALRDYTQIEGSNWLFVGDFGLRHFIAQEVDRLDDIISYEVIIDPLPVTQLLEMLDKRIKFYGESEKAELPIDKDVFIYLYKMTSGRLRYVFGLAARLMNRLYVGDLTDKVTLAIAKPMLMELGRARVQRSDLTDTEEATLKLLVQLTSATPAQMAKQLNKSAQYIGRILSGLVDKRLVLSKKSRRERIYVPVIDAIIAFNEPKSSH